MNLVTYMLLGLHYYYVVTLSIPNNTASGPLESPQEMSAVVIVIKPVAQGKGRSRDLGNGKEVLERQVGGPCGA